MSMIVAAIFEIIARLVHIDIGKPLHIFEKLLGDLGDKNVPDLDFFLLDEIQKEVERPFKIVQNRRIIHFRIEILYRFNRKLFHKTPLFT